MTETNLICGNISDEAYRTYTIYTCGQGLVHTFRFDDPKKVFYGPGHAFHRVFDGECVTLAPTPGFIREDGKIIGFCELSWKPKNTENPCQW